MKVINCSHSATEPHYNYLREYWTAKRDSCSSNSLVPRVFATINKLLTR